MTVDYFPADRVNNYLTAHVSTLYWHWNWMIGFPVCGVGLVGHTGQVLQLFVFN